MNETVNIFKNENPEITEDWEVKLKFKKKYSKTLKEAIIPRITEELERKHIKYEIPENEEADMIIQKYKINIVTMNYPNETREKRKEIIRKCREDPENTILIFLSKRSKRLFAKSKIKEEVKKTNRFFTLAEFINKIEDLLEYPKKDKKGMIPKISRELENMNIQYEKPKNKEADLIIQKYKINIVTMLKPRKDTEDMKKLIRKCRKEPDNTILIFRTLGSRIRFMESNLSEIITMKHRFFTIEGFLKWIEKEVKA